MMNITGKKIMCVNVMRMDHGLKESWHIRNLSNSIVKEGTDCSSDRLLCESHKHAEDNLCSARYQYNHVCLFISVYNIYTCCLIIPSVQNCYNRLAIIYLLAFCLGVLSLLLHFHPLQASTLWSPLGLTGAVEL